MRFLVRALVLAALVGGVPLAQGAPEPASRLPMPISARGEPQAALAAEAASPLSLARLTAAESLWSARLYPAMDASSTLVDNTMLSGDSYSIGRDGGNYVEALLLAYRVTGDGRLLSRVYALTQLARTKLRDAWLDGTTDGFTDWLWLADSTDATFYGKDTDWLDESIASGNVALWANAFQLNRARDPRYAEAADFWRGWLETQFLAKWYQRAGDSLTAWDTPYAAFYKPDTEPRSANWRLASNLYALTGNPFYAARAEEIRAQLAAAQVVNPAHPAAYRWAKELDPTTQDWQLVNYANYYMRVVIEMHLAGVAPFASGSEMARFAAAFRDVVYSGSLPALATMTNDVNGGGSNAYALYAFNGFAAWDSTGFLANLAERSFTGAGRYAAGGQSKAARNDVFLSAYALMALAMSSPTTDVGPRRVARPADGTLLSLGPATPNPFADATEVSYRLSSATHVRVEVRDAAGRTVRVLTDDTVEAGTHTTRWDGRDAQGRAAPPGVYFVVAGDGQGTVARRAVRVR